MNWLVLEARRPFSFAGGDKWRIVSTCSIEQARADVLGLELAERLELGG